MDCPDNTSGDSVASGCTPDAGYHGVITATTTAPFYATDSFNGADVQLCTSQGTGVCTTDATVCATKAGQTTKMACADPADGRYLDDGIATGTCVRVLPACAP